MINNDKNENGNQNININKVKIESKKFINKNIFKNNPQKPSIKNILLFWKIQISNIYDKYQE